MDDKEIAEFVKSRDEAFISFVMDDSLDKFYEHCKKYPVKMPKDESVIKAGIYKAVQECTDIPDSVKAAAFIKCSMMGFKPYADWSDHE